MVNSGRAITEIAEAANSFNKAYQQLSESEDQAVLVPAIHCAAVAIELYLKSLSGKNADSPSFFDPGVSTIVAAGERGHDLQKLFDKASQSMKSLLECAASKKEVLLSRADPGSTGAVPADLFRNVLGSLNGLFSRSRYPYEADSSVSVSLDLISAVLDVFAEAIGK